MKTYIALKNGDNILGVLTQKNSDNQETEELIKSIHYRIRVLNANDPAHDLNYQDLISIITANSYLDLISYMQSAKNHATVDLNQPFDLDANLTISPCFPNHYADEDCTIRYICIPAEL